MSHNTNAKVNPFYIQDDEEDPWDDDYGEDDYNDEQMMLMSESANHHNRKYNVSTAFPNNPDRRQSAFGRQNFNMSYHDSQYEMHESHRQHRPQAWKYGVILFTIVAAAVFGSSLPSKGDGNNAGSSENYVSLIDEIPNDEYRIVVLGERHSGTVWIRDRLRECFPHAEVSNRLQRKGYFFQDDEATARAKEETLGKHHQKSKNNRDTIVVHVTLNIYDWLEQMRLSPEYAPDHVGTHHELGHLVPLEWEDFLSKPWTTERPSADLLLANESGPVCQMGFHYNEVVSCSEPGRGIGYPMYELQREGGDGQPFDSIIDLRTAKLKNHHNVSVSWPSVKKLIQVSYETIAQDFKTKLLEDILIFTGWNGGSFDHNGMSLPCGGNGNFLPPSLDSSKKMTQEFVDYVNHHADWETEKEVASYEPWTEIEIEAKGIRPAKSTSTSPETVNTNNNSEGKDDETEKTVTNDKKEEKATTAEPDEPLPLSSNEPSNDEKNLEDEPPKPKGKDDDLENSIQNEGSNDKSPSVSNTKEEAISSESSIEEKTIEEVEDNGSPTPSDKKEPSNEKGSESSDPSEKESPDGSIDATKEENKEERDVSSIDSAASVKNTSSEKENVDLSSGGSNTNPSIDTPPDGSIDAPVSTESVTTQEKDLNTQEEAPSAESTQSNEEALTAKKDNEKETGNEKDTASDNKKIKQMEGDANNTTESESVGESENGISKSEEHSGASENNENDSTR